MEEGSNLVRKVSYNPIRVPVELTSQSKTIKGADAIRVSKLTKEARDGKFMKYLFEDTKTLYDVFRKGVRESNNGPCLGWRETPSSPYHWLHYNEALLRARNFGAGMVRLGLKPGGSTCVGIYSHNCPEWVLAEQGIYCQSMVLVPLHDSICSDGSTLICNQAGLSAVVVHDDTLAQNLLKSPPKSLRLLVAMRRLSEATRDKLANLGIPYNPFEEVENLGAESGIGDSPPRPEDLCTITYTQGTCGSPKGVMLTHENVVSSVSAAILQLGEHKPTKDDVLLSFLPLAHILERTCEAALHMAGGAVGFYQGDIKLLTEDYMALKPTISPSVPRLINRLYDRAVGNSESSWLKRTLLKMALATKKAQLDRGIVSRSILWDRLVFKGVQGELGGRIRLMVVGSAPLKADILTFMRCALGCVILEGYGQTECSSCSTLTFPGDHQAGQVGPPLASNAIKLADVTDLDYYAAQGQGEICVKGSNVFQGYWKDAEKTRDAIDAQGWLHTGDIGHWQHNGTIKIIDRKKQIFKISQGEYIAPEKLETIFLRCPFILQVFVYGESLKSCIVAIVVPEVERLKGWAKEQYIEGTLSVLCVDPRVKQFLLTQMTDIGKKAGLKYFELVKDIYLHPDPFSLQNGLLTANLKLKRSKLKDYFKPQLDDLYDHLK